MFLTAEADAVYLVGGTPWRVEGGGFVEKNFVRVSMRDEGLLRFKSNTRDGKEILTGYEMRGELNASGLGINAWSYYGADDYSVPIVIEDFNPSMSRPLRLRPFTVDGLTYTVEFTSVTSGRVSVSGYIDVDGVGRCEVNGENVIWKEGTPRPDLPDAVSGCDSGSGWFAIPSALLAAVLFRRRIF
jgi:hypothetical protein